MLGRDEKRGRIRSGVGFAALLAGLWISTPTVRGQSRLEPLGTRAWTVGWALDRATRTAEAKLADPSCRLLFSDFQDLAGHRLQDTLDALGQTGQSYFRGLVFYDGFGRSACASDHTVAFTSPGSRAIFVCSPQFTAMAHRQQGLLGALLIHEELHALGLGENPPSSLEITARVVARCGR